MLKKIAVPLIYTSLATLIVGYLFRILNWPDSNAILNLGFWLHVGSYILYVFQNKDSDPRALYNVSALLLFVLGNIFNLFDWESQNFRIGFAVVFLIYIGYHLIVKTYLGKAVPKGIQLANYVFLILAFLSIGLKLNLLSGADMVFIISSGALAILSMVTGTIKGVPNK